ncbi:MAG: F0F1 ATP synthase subunit alpha [Oscillospiraceae bacterium]|nr:F0F1 ATP synthase subunit alpha [Oscillospiraceae bacterium]
MSEPGISAFLKKRISEYQFNPVTYKKGTVIKSSDGVVTVGGIGNARYGELLEFGNGVFGMALELSQAEVGAVLFDTAESVQSGQSVRGTGMVAQVPVGENLLGRIIDPIGRPLDGKPLSAAKYYPAERPAPSIIDRRPVDTPLATGILAIDSMIPIGRGQRELIIGDRQTGKTTIAIDSIINQKNTEVICVYCAIGQKASTVAGVIETLKKAEALNYTVVVHAGASDSAAMQYLAPYSACSVAEYFAEQGKDVLIVYDDLSKHAVAYRMMSLLLLRPPGREAFPGDIFYLHSRLLERSACLSKEKGGGSITALPIVETLDGNISAYIPTNVISITDGQVYLESDLFHSGVRPAVNTGLSVSRVGRAAQTKAMKAVSGTLRIDLSQYRETQIFTRFGSDPDPATAKLLKRGSTLMNILKQSNSSPYSLFQQICLLIAHKEGLFLNIPEKLFRNTIRDYLSFMEKECIKTANEMNADGDMGEQRLNEITAAAKSFAKERALL